MEKCIICMSEAPIRLNNGLHRVIDGIKELIKIPCPGCGVEVLLTNYNNHTQVICLQRPLSCLGCQQGIGLQRFATHVKERCLGFKQSKIIDLDYFTPKFRDNDTFWHSFMFGIEEFVVIVHHVALFRQNSMKVQVFKMTEGVLEIAKDYAFIIKLTNNCATHIVAPSVTFRFTGDGISDTNVYHLLSDSQALAMLDTEDFKSLDVALKVLPA